MSRQAKQNDTAIILQTLAADYIEVLGTTRSTRLSRDRTCIVSLIRKTFAASAGEPYYQDPGNCYIVVLEQHSRTQWHRLYEQLVGHGCEGKLVVKDFNRDGRDEVFFWIGGQISTSGVFQLAGKVAQWLYKTQGRFKAEIQDIEKDGLWEVVEHWLTQDLEEPYYSQVARQKYVLALKIWRWDRSQRTYRLAEVKPDIEGQKRLSREELIHVPGAREILGLPGH